VSVGGTLVSGGHGVAGRRVLVVEDDRKTAETVRLYLEHAGFAVSLAADGARGLAAARADRFDLVVLDIMLPGLDGLQICRALRTQPDTAVIMLTARTTEGDRILGLDLGADDYVTKPFSPRELVARVKAVLRRGRPGAPATGRRIEAGSVAIDEVTREVHVRGELVNLTPSELAILRTLVRRPGRVFTREELVEVALTDDYDGTGRTVDTHVTNLRRKIEIDRRNPALITTVFGVGYRFSGCT
jgi:DNA-binding response OmpR family regulator